MQQADHVVTLIDSESAATNVRHMAEGAGWQAQVTQKGTDWIVDMTRQGPAPEAEPRPAGRAEPLAGPLVLAITADGIGRGNPELGQILMRSFFDTLTGVLPRPECILLLNAGVKLACRESAVLEDLAALEELGVTILVCRTCLRYFGLEEMLAAGRISNMYDIAETMFKAGKVVNL